MTDLDKVNEMLEIRLKEVPDHCEKAAERIRKQIENKGDEYWKLLEMWNERHYEERFSLTLKECYMNNELDLRCCGNCCYRHRLDMGEVHEERCIKFKKSMPSNAVCNMWAWDFYTANCRISNANKSAL